MEEQEKAAEDEKEKAKEEKQEEVAAWSLQLFNQCSQKEATHRRSAGETEEQEKEEQEKKENVKKNAVVGLGDGIFN